MKELIHYNKFTFEGKWTIVKYYFSILILATTTYVLPNITNIFRRVRNNAIGKGRNSDIDPIPILI